MSYAGDITCKDCWEVLETDANAQLIDVRTSAEWAFVGIPSLEQLGKSPILLEWKQYPSMQINPDFVELVKSKCDELGSGQDTKLLAICQAGVRSIAAAKALTKSGFDQVYNVLGGFEGNPDQSTPHGAMNGWKADQLPWVKE